MRPRPSILATVAYAALLFETARSAFELELYRKIIVDPRLLAPCRRSYMEQTARSSCTTCMFWQRNVAIEGRTSRGRHTF